MRLWIQVWENWSITSLHRCYRNSQMTPYFCFYFVSFATRRAPSMKSACRSNAKLCVRSVQCRWHIRTEEHSHTDSEQSLVVRTRLSSAVCTGFSSLGCFMKQDQSALQPTFSSHSAAQETLRSWWSMAKCPTSFAWLWGSPWPRLSSSLFFVMSHL